MKSRLLSVSFLLLFLSTRAQFTMGGLQLSSDSTWSETSMTAMNSENSAWVVWCGLDTDSLRQDVIYGNIYLTGFNYIGYPLPGYTNGAVVIGINGNYSMPQIIMGNDSEIIVTWYGNADSTSAFSHVYIQKYSASGVPLWNNGIPIQVSTTTDSTRNRYPQLASDKNGGAYVSWTRDAKAPDFASADVLLQRFDSNGNVASGWSTVPDGVAALHGVRESPAKIAVTKSGDALYVQYFRDLDSLTLWLVRINAADGSIAAGFSTGSGVLVSAGSHLVPYLLADNFIFSDSLGNALSVWTEYRTSGNGEIYYQKTLVNGTQSFLMNGVMIAGKQFTDGFSYMNALLDDDGSILAAWNDYTNPNVSAPSDIGCIKFKTNGSTVWQHVNYPITSNGYSEYPKILPDHLGGSYIFYDDYSHDPHPLNCVRLDASGTLTWPVPGITVGLNHDENGTQPQFDFLVANVNSKQTNVTWEYKINGIYHVFACNVLPSKQSCFDIPEAIPFYSAAGSMTIFPNPSKDKFTVSFSGKASSTVLHFELYNEVGMLVMQQALKETAVISTSGLSAGFYFGKVIDEQGACLDVRKIILE